MIGVRRTARMHLVIFLLTMNLGMLAWAHPSSQSASSANLHRSTTELVSLATPATGLYFDHVVTILMENQASSTFATTARRRAMPTRPSTPSSAI